MDTDNKRTEAADSAGITGAARRTYLDSAFDRDIGVSKSVWRYASSSRAHIVVDAADYFETVQAAMLNAKQRIMLIGWDFDTRITLGRGRKSAGGPPKRLGDYIIWLRSEERRVGKECRP